MRTSGLLSYTVMFKLKIDPERADGITTPTRPGSDTERTMYDHSCLRARVLHAGGDRSTTYLKINLSDIDEPLVQGWGAVSGCKPSERLFRQHGSRLWVHLIASPKCQYAA